MEGITTIRASRNHYKLISEFDEHQDMFTSAFHMMQCASRTFAYSLDILCNKFVASIIIALLIKGKSKLYNIIILLSFNILIDLVFYLTNNKILSIWLSILLQKI